MRRAPIVASSDQQVVDAALREHFPMFLQKVFQQLCSGEFVPGWHLDAIGYQLNRVLAGESLRSIINVPPRNLKSISLVASIAWHLGKNPEMRTIVVSYNAEFAAKLARDRRKIMESYWYQRVFPNVQLARATELEIETTAGGGCLGTSIGGTLTGLGADVIIIDDPMKAHDAMSDVARQQTREWVTSTLFSRLNDKRTGSICVVMQRLHEDDLTGYLLEQGGWDHLNLPAIAKEHQVIPIGEGRVHVREVGDILHPEREPREVLEQIKRDLGSNLFSAQYEQEPVPAAGTLVKRKWLRYGVIPAEVSGCQIIQSWDTASKVGLSNDYSVCITLLEHKNTFYVLDVYRGKLEFPDLLRMVEELAKRFLPDVLLIEDAASGQQLIQSLAADCPRDVPLPIACKPASDKTVRLCGCTGLIEAGGLVLPPQASWLADLERELLAFPGGKNDDQVDALSQALAWVRGRPRINHCPAILIPKDEDGDDFAQEGDPWCIL